MRLRYIVLALAVALVMPVEARKKKKKTEEEKPETEYHKVTGRDSVAFEGLAGVVESEGKLLLELPTSLLGREFMAVNRMQRVTAELGEADVSRGTNTSNAVVAFELDSDHKHIRMRHVRPTPLVAPDQRIAASVEANYANPIIAQWEVKALAPDSSTVIFPIHNLFDGDDPILNDAFRDINIGQSPSTKLSRLISLKAFESNIVATSELTTIVHEGNATVGVSVVVTTSLCLLPEQPMRGRQADPRVGYFQTQRLRYADRQQRPDPISYANRWRLVPSDTAAYMRGELVEPVKPITIYIDTATPDWLRLSIKQGIEDWNQAFERAGFCNAIRALVMPDSLTDSDDDVKYSMLTYAASKTSNAMGPSLTDPRTGEILEADIMWWHNVTELLADWLRTQTAPYCADTRCLDMPDSLMLDAARFVAAHEMGHSLGLRHNFIASASVPVDSLLSAGYVRRHGQTASIMDYARYNYVAQPGCGMPVVPARIGAYDLFAIEWGYRWWPDEQSEKEGLKALIDSHRADEFRYVGDQSARSAIDPRAMSEDMGDDPVRAATLGLDNLRRIVPNVIAWTTDGSDSQSYEAASDLYLSVMSQWNRYSYHVLANVGGIYIDNTVVGDGRETFRHVERERQISSVKWLINNVFTYPEWLFNTDITRYTYVMRHRDSHVVLQAPNQLYRFMLCYITWDLLDNDRMMRMADNELANGAAAFNATEFMEMLHDGFFAETMAGRKLNVMQRYVQKTFVDALITAASSASGVKIDRNRLVDDELTNDIMESLDCPMCGRLAADIRFGEYGKQVTRLSDPLSVKRGELTRIQALLRRMGNTGDQATRNHYADLLQRIETALAPQY